MIPPTSRPPTPPEVPGDLSREGADRERVLAEASALLVSPTGDPFPEILRLLGESVKVDRAWLFLFREGEGLMDNTHGWCAPGASTEVDRLQGLDRGGFPWLMEELNTGEPLVLDRIDDLPVGAAAEKEFMEVRGIRSMVVLPLLRGEGDVLGFMGFDQVERERSWTPEDVQALRVVGQMTARELDRRRTMDRLRSSEERHRLAGMATHDVLYDWNVTTGELIFAGSGGVLEGHVHRGPGAFEWWLGRIHPDDLEGVRTSLEAATSGTDLYWEAQYRFRRPEGEGWLVIRDRGCLVRDAEGQAVRMVGFMSDRTAQVAMEEELRHAHKMRAVGALAGGVAHDFNNVLTIILGYADFLSDDPDLSEEALEAVREIRAASERGAAVTGRLLAFSRGQVLQPVPTSVRDVLHRMQRLLARILPASIDLHLRPILGEPFVFADPSQIEQIVLNLVVNARDAMPSGGVLTIEVQRVELGEPPVGSGLTPGGYVSLEVEDSGEGMTEVVRTRAFEPFFTTRPPGRGTGLGLSTVYALTQQLGGWISIESEVGEGTRVLLLIPAYDG